MNIGRPIEFNRAEALHNAQQLFWRKGYGNTSLSDLLTVMGLSKSSFYQAFNSKHDLFEQSIQLYLKERTTLMRAKLKVSPNAYQFIAGMLCSVSQNVNIQEQPIGCLVMNTASEFAQSDEIIAKSIKQSMAAFTAVFKEAIVRGQSQGDISPDKDPDDLADFVMTNMAGLNLMVKAGADTKSIQDIAEITLSALK